MMAVADFNEGDVQGVLHTPEGEPKGGIVLSHGAGSDCRSEILVAACEAFAAAGYVALRCDLAFRQLSRVGPPRRGAGAADRASLAAAMTAIRARAPAPYWLGGHSYGGRQATMLSAEQNNVADALLLLSYPLHPPKQAMKLRTEHFPKLRVPCVFVHGEDDAFATTDELRAALALIPDTTKLISIKGARHDLRRGRINFPLVVETLAGL